MRPSRKASAISRAIAWLSRDRRGGVSYLHIPLHTYSETPITIARATSTMGGKWTKSIMAGDLFNADTALDIFACELVRIDKLGSNRRLIFAVPSTEGDRWKSVHVKLIIPADYMVTLAYMIAGESWGTIDEQLAAFEATGEPN